MYNLILSSRKPEAKAFKRWITHEVIPSINKTGNYDLNNNELLKQLTNSQINTNALLIGFKNQMDINQKTLEKHQKLLEKRVYLSPKEAQDVQKAMKNKAKQISVEHNLEYHCVKSTIFKRLYTALNEKFEVSTYRELPSIEFHNVLLAIQTLKIYTKDLKELNYQLDFDDDL